MNLEQCEQVSDHEEEMFTKYKNYFELWLNLPIVQIVRAEGILLSSHKERYLKPKKAMLYRPICGFETAKSIIISCIPEWEDEIRELLEYTQNSKMISKLTQFYARKGYLMDMPHKFFGLNTFHPQSNSPTAVLLDDSHYDLYYTFYKKANPRISESVDPQKWLPEEFSEMVKSKTYFCIIINNEMVSVTDAGKTINEPENIMNLGIKTLEGYRRKGYATAVCSAFIEYYLERGVLPIWECYSDNIASQSLAEKLGFQHMGNIFSLPTFEDLRKKYSV